MTETEKKINICGIEGNNPKTCKCIICKQYRNETVPYSQFMSAFTKSNQIWLATKLKVDFTSKEEAKQLGARWSPSERVWYVRFANHQYDTIVSRWGQQES